MEHEQQNSKSRVKLVFVICGIVIGLLGIVFGFADRIENKTYQIVLLIFSILLFGAMLLSLIGKKKREGMLAVIVALVTFSMLVFAIYRVFPDTEFGLEGCSVSKTTPTPTLTPTATIPPTPTPNKHEKLTHEQADGKIAAGYDFTILLRNDGTVVSLGGKAIDTSNWENIIQVAAYGDHALGLCENGAVMSTGLNVSGECDVASWENVKQVSACYQGTIAVTNDGRVLYTGFDKNGQSSCTSWTDMEKILGGEDHILGLKRNGTVVASGYGADKRKEVSGFKNVFAGDAANGSTFVVMWKDDTKQETVVKTIGANWANEDSVGGWMGVIDVSGGDEHTVGLRGDGTVVCSGANDKGQCNVKDWEKVVAICAGQFHTVGLCADGSLLATGQNHLGECNVSGMNYWVY